MAKVEKFDWYIVIALVFFKYEDMATVSAQFNYYRKDDDIKTVADAKKADKRDINTWKDHKLIHHFPVVEFHGTSNQAMNLGDKLTAKYRKEMREANKN